MDLYAIKGKREEPDTPMNASVVCMFAKQLDDDSSATRIHGPKQEKGFWSKRTGDEEQVKLKVM